nr:DUF21 domain-containing protein [Blattabacterium cuenoti]
MEVDFVSSNLFQIKIEKNKDSFYSKIIYRYMKNPNKFIKTILIGNSIYLMIYSIFYG